MTTEITTIPPIKLARLPASRGDSGYCGSPGSSQAEHVVELSLDSRGRWRAEASIRTGSNQGYFREDYSYGPWNAFGETAAKAVSALRLPAEWVDEIRVASGLALADADGVSWRSLLVAERERLVRVAAHCDAAPKIEKAKVTFFGDFLYLETHAERACVRERAIALIDRALARLGDPCDGITDQEILQSAKLRGLALA